MSNGLTIFCSKIVMCISWRSPVRIFISNQMKDVNYEYNTLITGKSIWFHVDVGRSTGTDPNVAYDANVY